MPETNIKLTGWQAVVVLIILAGIVTARFVTLGDMKDDKDLMKHINTQLMTEYSQHVTGKLKAAIDTSDKSKTDKTVESITSTKVNIKSVQASYPLFDFSIPKDVVIKVEFSLDDVSGTGDKRTIYYLFRHGAFGWSFQHKTTVMKYYLNFM